MLNYREYLLTCLSEECAEIQQRIGKNGKVMKSDIPSNLEMEYLKELIKGEY